MRRRGSSKTVETEGVAIRKIRAVSAAVCIVLLSGLAVAHAEPSCVGNPPRQTEDPLSPPCVPFFDGDNGGETSTGVTADRIDVVLYNDLGMNGVLGSGGVTGDATLVRTVEAQLRHFTGRYQSYGRTARVTALASPLGPLSTDAQRRADAAIAIELNPFATIYLGDGDPSAFVTATALAGVVNIGLLRRLSRAYLGSLNPYVWTFLPDQNTTAALSAGFLCRKLYGRTAQGAGDPAMRVRQRRIALVRPADPTDVLSQMGEQLRAAVSARCGRSLSEHVYAPSIPGLQAAQVMLRLKLLGVTTVACYCDERTMADARTAATAIAYFPEWYADDATGTLDAGGTAHATLGITSQWRGVAATEQYPVNFFRSEDPTGTWDARWNATVYYTLLTLFNAFQSAGPNLTPESVERGLHTFTHLDLSDVYVPVGGFGLYNLQASGNQSWIDTAMAWVWDPAGTEPDGTAAAGCRRVANDGKRAYPGGWTQGDDDLFAASMPCTTRVL